MLDPAEREIDFEDVVRQSSFAVVVTETGRADNPIRYVNPAFETLTGYRAAEVVGLDCRFLQGPRTDAAVVAELREAVRDGRAIRRELLNYRKDGEPFWNELTISPRHDEAGRLVGFLGIQNDVTARRSAEASLEHAVGQLQALVDNVPGFVFRRVQTADGTIVYPYASRSFAELMGLDAGEDITASSLRRRMHPADLQTLDQGLQRSAATLTPVTVEFRVIGADADERWVRAHLNPTRRGAEIVWDGLGLDVSSEKRAEKRLEFLAFHDPLTGLPNRLLFERSLQDAVALQKTRFVAVFALDLCALQQVNDSWGRAAGDGGLKEIAARLDELAAEKPLRSVARTGGDEFALYAGVETEAEIRDLAASIQALFQPPVRLGAVELSMSACVGFAWLARPGHVDLPPGDIVAELLRRAELALTIARRRGPASQCEYDQQADDSVRHQMRLRQSMPQAIARGEFQLHYHPLVDLASDAIVGAEALIRWRHPELGMQRPDVFIPIAEESGQIVDLGRWIIRDVMRQARDWRAQGVDAPRLSINVSAKQVLPSLPGELAQALADFGVDAARFELELTESVLMGQTAAAIDILNQIKAMGFTIAVDDFGTGYSSLQYLKDLPVDKIKIDQAFVRNMVIDSSDATLIRAIIAIARSLRMEVVAEGIETVAQRDFLREEGCSIGQGYLFSLPLVPEDFAWLLGSRRPARRTA